MTPVIARQLGLELVGTFHQRRGDQVLIGNDGAPAAAWARVFGEEHKRGSQQMLKGSQFNLGPVYDGRILGLQAGLDIYAKAYDNGWDGRFGVYYGHVESEGDIEAFTLARKNNPSGTLDLKGDYVGFYVTAIDDEGRYLDAVAQYGWLSSHSVSRRGIGLRLEGNSALASVEGGYPIQLSKTWRMEAQGQVIWQRVTVDQDADAFSRLSFRSTDNYVGRVGLRLEGDHVVRDAPVQSYLSMDVWHNFSSSHDVWFNDHAITIKETGNLLKLGLGFDAMLSENMSLFMAADWGRNIDGEKYETLGGNIGVRVTW